MYLAYLLTFFVEILSGWGENSTLLWSSRLRSGGEHFDPELAVQVWRGTLWSWAGGGGPAGELSDPELAVEVRRGTLWSRGCCWGPRSRACSWGPAGTTLIQRLLLGPGGEHCDLDFAVEVWQRKEKEGGRRQQAHVNFNNPDLTGGEKTPFGIWNFLSWYFLS